MNLRKKSTSRGIMVAFSISITYFLSTSFLFGHGVKITAEEKTPCVIVHSVYHGGSVLSGARIAIGYGPQNIKFQEGFTDKKGNFSFYPDKAGQWLITVDDLTGHRGKKTIELEESFFQNASPSQSQSTSITTPQKTETQIKPRPNPGKRVPPFTESDLYWYLVKIGLGIFLIGVTTYIIQRLLKRTESANKK